MDKAFSADTSAFKTDTAQLAKTLVFGLSSSGSISEDFDAPLPDDELALWEGSTNL